MFDITKIHLLFALLFSLPLQFPLARAQAPATVVLTKSTVAEDPDTLQNSALLAMQGKDWTQALSLWDRIIASKPNDAYAHGMRGSSLGELGRGDEALIAHRKAADIAPKDANVWNRLCWMLILLNRHQDARAVCEKSLALDPSNYAILVNLGHTFLLQGDAKSAQQWYEQSLQNINSESELKDGPLGDFEIFIDKGWHVESSLQAKAWFEREGAAWIARMEPANKILAEIDDVENDNDYLRSITLREKLINKTLPRPKGRGIQNSPG
jgi:tetratricopeptide (TPR) repeat protein